MRDQIDSLAKVYARSLYELAEQAGGRDKIVEVAEELEQVCALVREDAAVREFFRSPIVDRDARSRAMSRIFSNKVTDLTLRFLLVLNNKGRLAHLEAIAGGYDQLVQAAFGRVEVDIFTPAALGEEQLDSIRGRIREALGKEPVLYPYRDPSMIGGIKLRIGDQLIDASVATQLRRMKDSMLREGGAAVRERLGQLIDDSSD